MIYVYEIRSWVSEEFLEEIINDTTKWDCRWGNYITEEIWNNKDLWLMYKNNLK